LLLVVLPFLIKAVKEQQELRRGAVVEPGSGQVKPVVMAFKSGDVVTSLTPGQQYNLKVFLSSVSGSHNVLAAGFDLVLDNSVFRVDSAVCSSDFPRQARKVVSLGKDIVLLSCYRDSAIAISGFEKTLAEIGVTVKADAPGGQGTISFTRIEVPDAGDPNAPDLAVENVVASFNISGGPTPTNTPALPTPTITPGPSPVCDRPAPPVVTVHAHDEPHLHMKECGAEKCPGDPTIQCTNDPIPYWTWTDTDPGGDCAIDDTKIMRSWSQEYSFGRKVTRFSIPESQVKAHNDFLNLNVNFHNLGGWGGWSSKAKRAAKIDLESPPVPGYLLIQCDADQISVFWDQVTEDDGCGGIPNNMQHGAYHYQIATDIGFNNVIEGGWVDERTFVADDGGYSGTVYARVRVRDGVWNKSGWRSNSCVIEPPASCNITLGEPVPGVNSVLLNWQVSNSGADGIAIKRNQGLVYNSGIGEFPTSWSDFPLPCGVEYEYEIGCYKKTGTASYSYFDFQSQLTGAEDCGGPTATPTVTGTPPTATPTVFAGCQFDSLEASDGEEEDLIRINFNYTNCPDGHEVFVQRAPGGWQKLIPTHDHGSLTVVNRDLSCEESYTYCLLGVDGNGALYGGGLHCDGGSTSTCPVNPTSTPTPTPTVILSNCHVASCRPPDDREECDSLCVIEYGQICIPVQDGVCRFSPAVACCPDCPDGELGNLDCDNQSLINETDLSILLGDWSPGGPVPRPDEGYHLSDIAGYQGGPDGEVDEADLNRLLSNWKT